MPETPPLSAGVTAPDSLTSPHSGCSANPVTSPPSPKPDAALLEEIFPPRRIPGAEIGGIAPELGDYVRDFGDRAWTEVEDRAYQAHSDVYNLMDPETLIHYIAGFMRLALSSDYSGDAFFLVYFARSDRFVGFCNLLTTRQRIFVMEFIDHYIQTDDYSDDERIRYAANREQIVRTLETSP